MLCMTLAKCAIVLVEVRAAIVGKCFDVSLTVIAAVQLCNCGCGCLWMVNILTLCLMAL